MRQDAEANAEAFRLREQAEAEWLRAKVDAEMQAYGPSKKTEIS
ncbi:hypothetical protein FF011L_34900 [Roseimaritima multifibrata]|uniref:Uncharacterized protein n=1 Tax=Roseimaritima multifibrata TaxID=1930274 RepID=A0A517MIM4_9BACT|nr:hypothetical protein FF011L_34900 [Roseimaritima multifibrata]